MTLVLLLMAVLLTEAADAGKPVDLKGTWNITSTAGSDLKSIKDVTLTIGDKEAEWSNGIPPVFGEKGKGTIKIEAKNEPPTFELKVGDKVYKGFYRARVADSGNEDALILFISEPGGEFTKEFMKSDPFDMLSGFKGTRIAGIRKRK
jgi:hypothetical protein